MKLLLLFLLPCTLCMRSLAQSGEKNFIDRHYIEVTGKSEVEFAPDRIFIQVTISEKDSKNRVSVSELEARMFRKLKELGIPAETNVKLKNLSSNYRYGAFNRDVVLSKQYQVLVTDAKTASQLLAGLEAVDIANAGITKIESSRAEEFQLEAKNRSIADALNKAKAMAKTAGASIGKPLYIAELNTELPRFSAMNENAGYVNAKAASWQQQQAFIPEVDFDNLKIVASVLCRFELN